MIPCAYLVAAGMPPLQADPGTDLTGLLGAYGPLWAIVIYIFVRDIIPFIRDRLYPDIAADRKTKQENVRVAAERQIVMQEKMIDTLHTFQLSQAALASQIEHLAELFQQGELIRMQDNDKIGEALSIVKEDLAALYGKMDEPRPSRKSRPGT